MASDNSKKTPLFALHKKANAKIVEFGGWLMPVSYEGACLTPGIARLFTFKPKGLGRDPDSFGSFGPPDTSGMRFLK